MMPTKPDFAVMTVVTHDHLHFALALAACLAEHQPEAVLFVCVVDWRPATAESGHDNVKILRPEQFAIPQWRRFAFKYSPFELTCSLKPFVLEYVGKLGYSKLIYLDADIQVFSNLDSVLQLLDSHPVLLTPHVTQDIPEDGCKPTLAILRNAGIYNAGFIAVRTTDTGFRFLHWWKERCSNQCVVDLRGGYHVDQGWLDFVPAMFEGVCVVRNPGLNVAFWNLPHRPITIDPDGKYRVSGERLVFFHFSGLEPNRPTVLSKYQDRLDLSKDVVLQKIVAQYLRRLDEFGRAKYELSGYGFSNLVDGTLIQRKWREAVRVEDPRLASINDPFDTATQPHLKRSLLLAARDTLDARLDWHQRTSVGIGNLLERTPIIGRIYRRVRVLCEK